MASKDIKIDIQSTTTEFFLPVEKSSPKAAKLTFTPLEIEAWWLECMKLVRGVEIPGMEPIDVGFVAYSKNKKFERLINLSLLELQKERLTDKIGPIYYENLKSSLIPDHPVQALAHMGVMQTTLDLKESLITIGVDLLASPSNNRLEAGLRFYKQLKNPKDRFACIFLHELGHLFQFTQMSLDKNIDYSRVSGSPNFFYPGIPQTQEKLIQKLLNAGIHYREDGEAITFTTYQDLHNKYISIAKEMFADCFSALMYCKLNPGPGEREKIINAVTQERRSNTYGPAILDALEDEKIWPRTYSRIQPIDEFFCHNTSLALTRLGTIINERHIDVQSLNIQDIHNLCQECMNYGIINFIYETSLITPEYKSYLNAFIVDNEQGDMFNNNKRYTVDNLFDSLTPTDREKSQKFVSLYKEQIKNYENAPGYIANRAPFVKEAMLQTNEEFFGRPVNVNAFIDSPSQLTAPESQLDLIDKISSNRTDRVGVQLTAIDKHNRRVKVVLPKVYKDIKK